jgi:hypothetical protein
MYELIENRKLTTTASSIVFSNIPQNYSDLLILVSDRASRTGAVNDAILFRCNGVTMTGRRLFGSGSSATSTADFAAINVAQDATANTYSSISFYLSNYSSSTMTKSASVDAVGENNAALAYQSIAAGLYNSTSPVTEITLVQETGTLFLANTTATLYGINRRSGIGRAPLAMGGYMSYSNGYWVHTFPSSGSFIPFTNMEVEYLVVAGGGGGGGYSGGGAGGLLYNSAFSAVANTNYAVTIGAGGPGGASANNVRGTNGSNSVFNTSTAIGGGAGAANGTGADGGSGGGGGWNNSAAGVATQGNSGGATGFGNNGGNGYTNNSSIYNGGGGGGAGAPGTYGISQPNGGSGYLSSITGTPTFYAGGGGGGSIQAGGVGGQGGGGAGATNNGASTAGTVNTGGGGGGGRDNNGAAGGSGIVIVRYKA